MEVVALRPKLASFRATAFTGENRAESVLGQRWVLQLTQTIEVGLGIPIGPGGVLQAVVKISLVANGSNEAQPDEKAAFSADYEAKFNYANEVTEAEISHLILQEPYQYVLVAQAFPLAMTHFRRELQAMGFDARQLPLGV